MEKYILILYLGYEVGIELIDDTTVYGVLDYNRNRKFVISKQNKEFTSKDVKRIWLLKS